MTQRLLAPVLIARLCAGCSDERDTPAKAYVHWQDRIVAATHIPFFGFHPLCTRWVGNKIVGGWDRLPEDQCIRFNPPRRMSGLWRNDFEGSQFCEAPAKRCSFHDAENLIWFEPGSSLRDLQLDNPGALYQVDFVGRRTIYPGSYGHMGVFDEEVIVDRMISMKELEAPPRRPTDGTLK